LTLIFSCTKDDLYRVSSILSLGGSVILNVGEMYIFGLARSNFKPLKAGCLTPPPIILTDDVKVMQGYTSNKLARFLLEKFIDRGLAVVDSNPEAGYEGFGLSLINHHGFSSLMMMLKEAVTGYQIDPRVELHDAIVQLNPDAVVMDLPEGGPKLLTTLKTSGYSLELLREGSLKLETIEESLKGLYS
jgi:hypothetical protein